MEGWRSPVLPVELPAAARAGGQEDPAGLALQPVAGGDGGPPAARTSMGDEAMNIAASTSARERGSDRTLSIWSAPEATNARTRRRPPDRAPVRDRVRSASPSIVSAATPPSSSTSAATSTPPRSIVDGIVNIS